MKQLQRLTPEKDFSLCCLMICFDEFYSLHDCQFHFGQKVRFDWLEQRSIRFIKFETAVKDSDGKWQRPVYNK